MFDSTVKYQSMINDKYMDLVKPDYKRDYLNYMNGVPLGEYSSHQPVLIHVLNTITEGDVIELGVGDHSSAIMHAICTMQGRNLLSVDDDREWFKKYAFLKTDRHAMFLATTRSLINGDCPFFNHKFAVAFVDGSQYIRQPFINFMRDKVDYFVVHDTEAICVGVDYGFAQNPYNYNFKGFKHVLHFRSEYPATSVLSNLDEINSDLLSIFD